MVQGWERDAHICACDSQLIVSTLNLDHDAF